MNTLLILGSKPEPELPPVASYNAVACANGSGYSAARYGLLDPVYTGKAYFGMFSELEKNPEIFGGRIVFIHTGGLFGLFPVADQFEALL